MALNGLIADHWYVPSERRGPTSVWRGPTSVWREPTSVTCELTSDTRKLTSEIRDVTSVAWRVPMNRRRAPIGTVEVISERSCVPAQREEAPCDQRVVADEQRCVPAMGDDVPVVHQSVNFAHCSAPRHSGDVSDARAYAARERRVAAIARTEGMTRRWIVTARIDDATGRRRELPPNADDLADGVCEVPSIEDVRRSGLWMTTAGIGHSGDGVRAEIAVRGVSTYEIVTGGEMGALDAKGTSDSIVLILAQRQHDVARGSSNRRSQHMETCVRSTPSSSASAGRSALVSILTGLVRRVSEAAKGAATEAN